MRVTALAIVAILSFLIFLAATSDNTLVVAQTAEPLVSENLFDIDLLYAYVQPGVSSAITVLNFTRISNLTLPPNSGIIEVYTVHVFSEEKLVRTTGFIGGISGTGLHTSILMDLAMSGDFEAYENIGVIPFSVSFSPILYPDLVEPISLSVVRLGWITVVDNTTDINFSSNETVKQVKLTKYREGFLYNTLLPQEELSKIDLFTPLNSSYIASPTPSATPPPDEAPAIMFIPVGVGIGAVAAVAIIVIFLRIRK